MLEGLKKKLGIVSNVEAKEPESVADSMSVTFSVTDTEEYKELLEGFTEQSAQLDAALAQVNELTTQMSQFKEQASKAEADAKQVKMDARLASLSKDVGDERASAVLAATEGLDDIQFEAIAQALKLSADNEATSPLFTEAGVQGEAVPEAHQETAEMKQLKAKYKK